MRAVRFRAFKRYEWFWASSKKTSWNSWINGSTNSSFLVVRVMAERLTVGYGILERRLLLVQGPEVDLILVSGVSVVRNACLAQWHCPEQPTYVWVRSRYTAFTAERHLSGKFPSVKWNWSVNHLKERYKICISFYHFINLWLFIEIILVRL